MFFIIEKLSDQLLVKKIYLIFEVLRLVSAVFGSAKVLMNHTIWAFTRKTVNLRESFLSDWPIIAESLVYQVVSEHISYHGMKMHGNFLINPCSHSFFYLRVFIPPTNNICG